MDIVAIGGGEIRKRETLAIDQFIRDLPGKERPKLLFIPTASYDFASYCEVVSEIFGKELGCEVASLRLLSTQITAAEVEDRILNADIIYVGGGDTKKMLDTWEIFNVVCHMRKASDMGTVLSGVSAGAVCWFEYGCSDYESFSGDPHWEYRMLAGLALKKGIFCPHLDSESRYKSFKAMVERENIIGIGCDDNAAIWYHDEVLPTVVTSNLNSTVRILKPINGKSITTVYEDGQQVLI